MLRIARIRRSSSLFDSSSFLFSRWRARAANTFFFKRAREAAAQARLHAARALLPPLKLFSAYPALRRSSFDKKQVYKFFDLYFIIAFSSWLQALAWFDCYRLASPSFGNCRLEWSMVAWGHLRLPGVGQLRFTDCHSYSIDVYWNMVDSSCQFSGSFFCVIVLHWYVIDRHCCLIGFYR